MLIFVYCRDVPWEWRSDILSESPEYQRKMKQLKADIRASGKPYTDGSVTSLQTNTPFLSPSPSPTSGPAASLTRRGQSPSYRLTPPSSHLSLPSGPAANLTRRGQSPSLKGKTPSG